jgi:hypothetical protein
MDVYEISNDINETIRAYGLNYVRQNPEEVFVIPVITFESMETEELKELFEELAVVNKNWKLYYTALLSQSTTIEDFYV